MTINHLGIMRQISELETTLTHFLDWNKAGVTFLIQILQAPFIVRTVNLTHSPYTIHGPMETQANFDRGVEALAVLRRP